MDQLRAEIAQLSQQVALLTAQVAQMQAVRPRRKCPVAVPDKFDGSLAQFPAYFGQCQLYMSLQPEDFSTDRDKVGFLINLLSGSAARWATPLLTQPKQVLNYAEFSILNKTIGWKCCQWQNLLTTMLNMHPPLCPRSLPTMAFIHDFFL
uniref:DUF4939 domain-containing protein n=1 Tax=Naja naja TaxID=35670 RepID=A0A8C7DZ23_NAJNA